MLVILPYKVRQCFHIFIDQRQLKRVHLAVSVSLSIKKLIAASHRQASCTAVFKIIFMGHSLVGKFCNVTDFVPVADALDFFHVVLKQDCVEETKDIGLGHFRRFYLLFFYFLSKVFFTIDYTHFTFLRCINILIFFNHWWH